jgi:hypothetical protein
MRPLSVGAFDSAFHPAMDNLPAFRISVDSAQHIFLSERRLSSILAGESKLCQSVICNI